MFAWVWFPSKHCAFSSNVNKSKLAEYAKEASLYATGYYSRRLPHTNFATNSRGILYIKNSRSVVDKITNKHKRLNTSNHNIREKKKKAPLNSNCKSLTHKKDTNLLKPLSQSSKA